MFKNFVRVSFLLVGAVNFAPIVGVLGQASLVRLYGVDVLSLDVLALMKHRAVLLAIVGGLMIVAAFRAPYRLPASLCAYVSMVSYILIIGTTDVGNQALVKILQIDLAAVTLLLVANATDWRLARQLQAQSG